MALPANLPTGTVTANLMDGAGNPIAGTLEFHPEIVSIGDQTANAIVLPSKVTVPLVNGQMSETLVATDSPNETPIGWTWRCVPWLTGVSLPPFSFLLPSGSTVDLSTVVPVASTNGVPITQGPPNVLAVGTVTTGAAGSQATVVITGTSPAQVINFTIPKGDKGDQGIQGIQGVIGITPWLPVVPWATGLACTPGPPATVVTYNGETYVCTAGAPFVAGATFVPANWTKLAAQGIQGIQGIQGPANNIAGATASPVAPGGAPTAAVSGVYPNQQLALGIPSGLPGIQVVNHGVNGNTARPANIPVVYWTGTARPVNALATDLWFNG